MERESSGDRLTLRESPLSPQFSFRRRPRHSRSDDAMPLATSLLASMPSRLAQNAVSSTDVGRTVGENEGNEACSDQLGNGVAVRVMVRCRPPLDALVARSRLSSETFAPGKVNVTVQVPSATTPSPSASSTAPLLAARPVATPGRAASPRPQSPQQGLRSPGRRPSASRNGDGSSSRSFLCNCFCNESATQEEVFAQAAPVVDRVMEGYNGTIFCYGITGSGKTFTMSGPPQEKGSVRDPNLQGIVQRAAWRVFEFISQRSQQGEVFAVEASFLEVYSADGVRETLVDLLVDEKSNQHLEIKQDPHCPQSFLCEGLRRVPINSPDAMNEALEAGRRRCTFMETSRNCLSSRSHCLFLVTVECLIDRDNGAPPIVKRGKLVLVDLAGSESLKKVMASNEDDEELRRKQAIGINRVLSHLGSVVNNLNLGFQNSTGYRNTALTMLLRDCLGGSARALLIANVGPEAEWSSETSTTLTFAQQMMQVRNVEKAVVVDNEKSVLVQMRERHNECIRRLQEEPIGSDATPKQRQERSGLQAELDELNKRLLTKSKATETLEQLQEEQRRKMDAMRAEVAQTMAEQLQSVQGSLVQDIQGLQQVLESKAKEEGEKTEKRLIEKQEAELSSVQTELSSAVEARRVVEGDVAKLRVQLAAAEQRAQTLQELQSDVSRDRESFDKERRELADKASEQLQRTAEVEGEMQRYRSEASVLQSEVERLTAARACDTEVAAVETANRSILEAKTTADIQRLKDELGEQQKLVDLKAKEAEICHQQDIEKLKAQISKLEADTSSRRVEYEDVRIAQAKLQEELRIGRELEAALRQNLEQEVHEHEDKIDIANQNISEILTMLQQVQNSIMHATKPSRA